MTIHFIGCRMTARDFDTCRAMLANLAGGGSPLVAPLRQKLERAAVVPADAIDPMTVTVFSRVEFGVDDEPPQKRILVRNHFQNGLVGLTLPISTPRGLALLGLRQGQTSGFDEGGRERTLFVKRILYQPEAARAGHGFAVRQRQQPATVIDLAGARDARGFGQAAGGGRNSLLCGRKGTRN